MNQNNAVAPAVPTSPVAGAARNNLEAMLVQAEPDLAKSLPKHISPDRMLRVAYTVLRKRDARGNPSKLLQCEPASFFGALIQAFQVGLEVDTPLGLSYLVPFKKECTFIVGYKGFIKLAYQSGQVSSITAHVVHENDDFEIEYGSEETIRHKPKFGCTREERGNRIGAYAVVNLKGGGRIQRFMASEEILAARPGHWEHTPWNEKKGSAYVVDEMWTKTALRRTLKTAPLSAEALQSITFDEASSRNARISAHIIDDVVDVAAGVDIEEYQQERAPLNGSHKAKPQAAAEEPEAPAVSPAEQKVIGEIRELLPVQDAVEGELLSEASSQGLPLYESLEEYPLVDLKRLKTILTTM